MSERKINNIPPMPARVRCYSCAHPDVINPPIDGEVPELYVCEMCAEAYSSALDINSYDPYKDLNFIVCECCGDKFATFDDDKLCCTPRCMTIFLTAMRQPVSK